MMEIRACGADGTVVPSAFCSMDWLRLHCFSSECSICIGAALAIFIERYDIYDYTKQKGMDMRTVYAGTA